MSNNRFMYFGIAATFLVLASFATENGYFQTPAKDLRFALQQNQMMRQSAIPTAESSNIDRGLVRVIDGITLQFIDSRSKVRLSGVQTCAPRQLASYRGTPWPCGTVATAWLVSKTLGQTVECQFLLNTVADFQLARCGVDGHDLAADALSNGHAIIDENTQKGVPFSTYRAIQDQANEGQIGIWSSAFTEPNVWRRDRVVDSSSQVRQINLP